jgi:nucleoside 2-deoxyribosyltransferase
MQVDGEELEKTVKSLNSQKLNDKELEQLNKCLKQYFDEELNKGKNLVYYQLAEKGKDIEKMDIVTSIIYDKFKPVYLIDIDISQIYMSQIDMSQSVVSQICGKFAYKEFKDKDKIDNIRNQVAKSIDTRIKERVRTGFMRRTAAVDSNSNDFYGTVLDPAAAPGSDGSFRNSPTRFCIDLTVEEKQFKTGYFDGSWLTVFSSDHAYTVRVKKSTTGKPDAKDGTADKLIIETYTSRDKYLYREGVIDTNIAYSHLPFVPKDRTGFTITRIQNDGFANSPLTMEVLKKALADLKSAGASPMSDGVNEYWFCIIDQEIELDFMLDPRWKGADTYKKLYAGEIGMLSNIRFVRADIPRENKNGDYDPEGAYRVATLLGRQSFTVTLLKQKQYEYIGVTYIPLPLGCTPALGFKYLFVSSIINAAHGCNIICGTNSVKSTAPNSKSVFMAMKFDEEQKKFMRENVGSVVEEFGLELKLLPDIYAPENIIDVKMRNEIKKSRLLICDLTHRNNGAYFEAGYAEGLGNPVIYICEQKTFGEGKLHFDVEHQEIYKWKDGNEESIKKFKEDLKAKIKAVLGN